MWSEKDLESSQAYSTYPYRENVRVYRIRRGYHAGCLLIRIYKRIPEVIGTLWTSQFIIDHEELVTSKGDIVSLAVEEMLNEFRRSWRLRER